jgi:predicted Zn finger-like uncharacterized protein
MRIVCPACDATYDVPEAMLARGARKVRCARCGNEWAPSAAAPHAQLELEAAPDAALPDEDFDLPQVPETDPLGRHEPRLIPPRQRPERIAGPREPEADLPPARGSRRAIVAWVLTVLVLAAGGAAAVLWRAQVMATWPPSERVYSAVGLR